MAENIEQEIEITDKVWKVSMNTGGTKDNPITTKATLHSLFELLAYEDEGGRKLYCEDRTNPDNGAKLGHDIILFNKETYGNTGLPDQNTLANWCKFDGIDLRCPNYDTRAKLNPYSIDLRTANFGIGGGDGENFNGIYSVYNKSGALLPRNVVDFHIDWDETDNQWPPVSPDSLDDTDEGVESKQKNLHADSSSIFSIATEDEAITNNRDIILCRQDKVFHSSIVFNNQKETYTRMYLNCTYKIAKFVAHCLFKHLTDEAKEEGYADRVSNTLTALSYNVDNVESYRTFLKNIVEDEKISFLLKHIYIWVRAPYAGDYVRPEDFDQDLNKDSTVIHKNLYLRKENGDLNRYNETDKSIGLPNEGKEEENTQAYTPNNVPLKDYITPEIIESLKKKDGNIDNTVENNIDILKKYSSDPESEIGSIFTASKDETYQTVYSRPNFFEPERSLEENYTKDFEKVPSVIPKSGNLVVDSRILSPTIDELWYTLKKVIFGRNIDNNISNNSEEPDLPKSYYGKIVGNQPNGVNDKDTTLHEAEKINFLFNYVGDSNSKNDSVPKIGDPVEFKKVIYTNQSGDTAEETCVKEFFSNPDAVVYTDYKNLREDFKRINKWKRIDNELIPNFSNVKVSDVIFTQENVDGTDNPKRESIFHKTRVNTDDYEYEIITKCREWLPRPAPLSLRELEARTLGNKYALVKAVKHIATNFVVAGALGVHEDTNGFETMGGSLYQLHKDYNLVPENPNSMFRRYGEGKNYYANIDNNKIDPTSGIDAVFSDNQSNEIDIITNHSTIDSDTDTTNMRFSHMPKLVNNYGTSDYIEEESGDYSGADVYLSALGDWRYIGEHVRVPILRSRY